MKRTHEVFMAEFKMKQPVLFDKVEIISKYINNITPITIKSKLGYHTLQPQGLLAGNTPSIKTVDNKLDYFKAQLKQTQPKIYDNVEIIDDYIDAKSPLKVKLKYGICLTTASLLLKGTTPTIQCAINKTEFFKNHILDVNPSLLENCEIISEYITNMTPILVLTKFGIVKVIPNNLFKATSFSIRGAVNKTEFLINQFKEVHGNLYDYSLVTFKSMKSKIKIISENGIFEQRPNDHLDGAGCQILGREKSAKYHRDNPSSSYIDSEWVEKGLKSKRFDSFKCYIIKCWDDNEEFYKIGKTFTSVKYRFKSKRELPYKYEIIKEIVDNDGIVICNLERNLQKELENFRYVPKIHFAGKYECFSDINDLIF